MKTKPAALAWVKAVRAVKAGLRKVELLRPAVRNNPLEALRRLQVQRIRAAPAEIRMRLGQLRLGVAPLSAAHLLLEEQWVVVVRSPWEVAHRLVEPSTREDCLRPAELWQRAEPS